MSKSDIPAICDAFLEHYSEHGRQLDRLTLTVLPATIGRAETNDLRVYVPAVSKHHAVFLPHDHGCRLRDMGSTNGTFVNGVRITECVLNDGDIIHLGPMEFCFRSHSQIGTPMPTASTLATQALPRVSPESMIRAAQRMRELIATEAVDILFQPIVDLNTQSVFGFEALARGRHPALSRHPVALFRIAEQCGVAVELSQLLQRLAVERAHALPAGARLFVNVHPRELVAPRFLSALEQLRDHRARDQVVVLEIAESSVTNVEAMTRTRDAITTLGFEFAYDDFGAGQARLLELTDIPPHFLKLDMAVIKGIEEAASRQEVIRAMLEAVGTLGVRVIAEGIETEAGATACRRMGCHLGQGFLYGRPTSL